VANGCADISGEISVTNINTGASVTGGSFTYRITQPAINGVVPSSSCPDPMTNCPNNGMGGGAATILGVNFPASPANVDVKFGSQTAFVNSASSTSLDVTVPTTTVGAPACEGSNTPGTYQVAATVDVTVMDRTTTCSVTAAQAFQYLLPCTGPAPTPTP
jgi:hypothetical protein